MAINLETKEKYKNLFKKLNTQEEVMEALTDIIDSYDGVEESLFHSIMLTFIILLSENKDLTITKNGYDQIVQLSKGTSEQVNSVLNRFKDLQDGKEPPQPVTAPTI